jgi:D-glycero-beta-D-manno-heptose 1-phosphate adenylyltransferase
MPERQIDLIGSKIVRRGAHILQIELWKQVHETIVFTNGCFDILHRGHLEYLAASADLGTKLIVGLNSDASVSRLKGSGRPLNNFADRALALASLQMVHMVVPFEEDTPEMLIREISPQVLVKGGDYRLEQIAGAAYVSEMGGKVAIISFTEGYSTTSFINRLREQ